MVVEIQSVSAKKKKMFADSEQDLEQNPNCALPCVHHWNFNKPKIIVHFPAN